MKPPAEEKVKTVYIEPAWKQAIASRDLTLHPPEGYRFVTAESLGERTAKVAARTGMAYTMLGRLGSILPVNLVRSYLGKFGKKPEGADLTYAWAHLVLRKEPWVLDMPCEWPYILASTSGRYFSLYQSVVKKVLNSGYCRKIICRVAAIKQDFLAHFGDELESKIAVVYWGVPRKDFTKTYTEDRVKLLFVNSANINSHAHFNLKGGNELLEAFLALNRRYDNLELVVRSGITKGTKEKYSQVKNIRFIDTPILWEELEQEWQSADIFVLPTWVTPAMVLFDAMSYELPIVTTDTPGNPEVVEDGKTGLLVHRRLVDSLDHELVQALVEKISLLIENQELRRRMGGEARHQAETIFSIEKRNERLKRVLDEATSS
jgi:glycosyltransferase involved in cell wall biosynthesis